MDDYYAALDITRNEGAVSWASDGPVPVWFDIAQDLTERWVHCQQMREAVNRPGDHAEKYLEFVLRTFVWALPHQYRVPAPAGTQVEVDLEVGRWCLTFDSLRWSLQETAAEAPAASVRASADSAWRWLTGGSDDETQLIKDGPASLVEPLLKVRAILV